MPQKMAGETLSDVYIRGTPRKVLANESQLQSRVFRNTSRRPLYQTVREEVTSALTAERSVHGSDGDYFVDPGR